MDIYRKRFNTHSNKPYPLMDLTDPLLGFSEIAQGFGVHAEQITDPNTIGERVRAAFESKQPTLLDIVVSGKEFGVG
jgi:thiamine pyrophosphate-dependent acetolactate synthase large subunit-like protein